MPDESGLMPAEGTAPDSAPGYVPDYGPTAAAAPEPAAPEVSSASLPDSIPTEPFTNSYNVNIDPTTPHAYVYVGPDGKPMLDAAGNRMYAMYGGSKDDIAKAAEDFLRAHPDTSVRFQIDHADAITGERTVQTLELGSAQGHVVMHPPSIFGEPLPPPDPKTFTELVPYAYKPR